MSVLLINANTAQTPLADKSVHMVCTSPPYFGLRAYSGSQHLVWGGDADCSHDWIFQNRKGMTGGTVSSKVKIKGKENFQAFGPTAHATCRNCGAWYGPYGHEPLHDCLGWATGSTCNACYVCHTRTWAREIWRVLRDDGVFWLNIGDSYNGSGGAGGDYNEGGLREGQPTYPGRNLRGLKAKDLIGTPWRVCLALQADGWFLRSDITWLRPNSMPEPVLDRPSRVHEFVFLFTKRQRYFFDAAAVREPNSSPHQLDHNRKYARFYDAYDRRATHTGQPGKMNNVGIHSRSGGSGRNLRSVWVVSAQPTPFAHFATWPPRLAERMIKAGSSERGVCPTCKAPFVRVVAVPDYKEAPQRKSHKDAGEWHEIGYRTSDGKAWQEWRNQNPDQTIGWRPSCRCYPDIPAWTFGSGLINNRVAPEDLEAARAVLSSYADLPTKKAIVLDPFVGSGTTLQVARQLDRNGIGIDLSLPYLNGAAKERLQIDLLDRWSGKIIKHSASPESSGLDDLPLFNTGE